METGYLPKTKMSEFDGFLPHLKKINHRYPVFGFRVKGRSPYRKGAFSRGFVGVGTSGRGAPPRMK